MLFRFPVQGSRFRVVDLLKYAGNGKICPSGNAF
jgi:hypothetical protein